MSTTDHTTPAHLLRDRIRIKCGVRGCHDILCWVNTTWERIEDVIFIRYLVFGPGPVAMKIKTIDFPAHEWKLLIRRAESEPSREMEAE